MLHGLITISYMKGIICRDRHWQKIAVSAENNFPCFFFSRCFMIYSQSIRSFAAMIGMIDCSTSAATTTKKKIQQCITPMEKTIEQTTLGTRWQTKGMHLGGKLDSWALQLHTTRHINIYPIIVVLI